jgi:hypothetical protein
MLSPKAVSIPKYRPCYSLRGGDWARECDVNVFPPHPGPVL